MLSADIGETELFGSFHMSFVTRVLATGLIVIGVAGTAQADVLYNNMTNTGGALYPGSMTPQVVGASFNTDGASNLDLTDIQLWLGGGGIATSSLVVTLQTDNAGVPSGHSLASWTVADTAVANWGGYDFHLTSPMALTGSTTYWVMAQDSGGAGWFNTAYTNGTPQSGPGQIGNQFVFFDNLATQNSGNGTAQEMCVITGGSTCTISGGSLQNTFDQTAPEPGSLALLGVAVIGLGVARRYRKS